MIPPWLALHSYRQEGEWDAMEALRFYQRWLRTIPQYSTTGAACNCMEHWTVITDQVPPVFTSELKFIQWGFDRHNDVNAKVGNPQFSIDEAWKIRCSQ